MKSGTFHEVKIIGDHTKMGAFYGSFYGSYGSKESGCSKRWNPVFEPKKAFVQKCLWA